jgi:hypothetical protein
LVIYIIDNINLINNNYTDDNDNDNDNDNDVNKNINPINQNLNLIKKIIQNTIIQ